MSEPFITPLGPINTMESNTADIIPQEIPAASNVVVQPITDSIKPDINSETIKTEVKQETTESYLPTTAPVTYTNAAPIPIKQDTEPKRMGNHGYEVSDDDYTNDYTEMSSKRRRRETRQAAAQQMVAIPILKGRYSIEDKVCTWEGKWGMGTNGQINGVTSDFQYTMQISSDAPISNGPQSGIYNGFFWMKVNPSRRISDNDLRIDFTQDGAIYRVSGSGENRIGAFTLSGTYNPETMEMVCTKIYNQSLPTNRSGRTRYHDGVEPEREYRCAPRQATPSFLRENADVPAGLSEDMKMCYKSLKRLMNHKWSGPFLKPVDPVALCIPDYFDIIKHPMDFTTIQNNLENHVIVNRDDFASAIRLVFDNAFKYNKPGDDVHIMAKTLSDLFEKDFMQINRRIFESEPDPPSPVYNNKISKHISSKSKVRSSKSKNAKNSKYKKNTSHRSTTDAEYEDMQNRIFMLQNQVKLMEEKLKVINATEGEQEVDDSRPMTVEEKKELSKQINTLSGENLQKIVDIIELSLHLDRQDGEIEIDLDKIPNETLRKMQDFVKQCNMSEGSIGRKSKRYDMPNETELVPADIFQSMNSDSGKRCELRLIV